MKNTFKNAIRTASMVAVALFGISSPAHATADNYIFGFSGGFGDQVLNINNGQFVLQATNTGWYENNGITQTPDNTNYIAGTTVGATYQDFFSFNLSSLSGVTITSASISLFNSGSGYLGNPGVYNLYDANRIASALLSGTNSQTTYNSMTSGHIAGSSAVSTALNNGGSGEDLVINLDSNALGSIARHEGSTFTVAGALSAVPLPAGLPMFVAALLATFGVAQYRQRKFA